MVSLVGVYRGGWRWPLRRLEVWRAHELLADIPEDLLIQLVLHHLNGVALERAMRRAIPGAQTDDEIRGPRLQGVDGRKLRGR